MTTNSSPGEANGQPAKRKTHIEVCVRIRPLLIGTESSNSFLVDRSSAAGSTNAGASRLSPPRRSRVSPTTPGSRFKNLFKRSPSSHHNQSQQDDSVVAWEQVGNGSTVQQSAQTNRISGRTHAYTVDQVYGAKATTAQLFDQSGVADLCQAAVDGYHTAVLAYGQTSTGKTHTMTGTCREPGIIPLAVGECFRYISSQDVPKEYLLRVVCGRVLCEFVTVNY